MARAKTPEIQNPSIKEWQNMSKSKAEIVRDQQSLDEMGYYLTMVAEKQKTAELLPAFYHVAHVVEKVRGSEASGLVKQVTRKVSRLGKEPRFKTILEVAGMLGFKVVFVPPKITEKPE
jgi:DNA-binding phage protein